MKVHVISVGKKHDDLLKLAIQEYEKRLSNTLVLDWYFIPPSSLQHGDARAAESAKICAHLKPSDTVWLLDERGEQFTSPAISGKLQVLKTQGINRLVIIIGGAYGVDDTVRTRANMVWSLSSLVFPHQIVRLLLIEQLYRADQIAKNTNYHHA